MEGWHSAAKPDEWNDPSRWCYADFNNFPVFSLRLNREEAEMVQGGRSHSGLAEPQARPRRVPAQTRKLPRSRLHLCVQHNQWQHAELSSDGQQHSLLCVLLLAELRCGQQIGPVAKMDISQKTPKLTSSITLPLNVYSIYFQFDSKLILEVWSLKGVVGLFFFPPNI